MGGDVPRSASCVVCVSWLVRFAGASGCVAGFNIPSELLTQRLLGQGCCCRKLRRTFSGFCRQYCGLVSRFQVGLKSLWRRGLSEPDFYGDLVYKLKKIVRSIIFQGSSLEWFPRLLMRW